MSNAVRIYFYNLWEQRLFGIYNKSQEYSGSRDPKRLRISASGQNVFFLKSTMKSRNNCKIRENSPHFGHHLKI